METIPVTINLPPDMVQKLTPLAEAQGLSFEGLVRAILKTHIAKEPSKIDHKMFPGSSKVVLPKPTAAPAKPKAASRPKPAQDKRLYPRKEVTTPVNLSLEVDQEEISDPALALKDISLGGSLLVLPKQDQKLVELITQGQPFKIVIDIPDEEEGLSITCQARRVSAAADHVLVGISFDSYDYYDLIKLYKLLE